MARLTRILLLVDLTCLLTCGLHLTRDKEPQGLASFRTGLLLIVSLMLFGCTHTQSAAESRALETANNPRDATYLIEGEDAGLGLPLVTRAYRMLPGSLEIQLIFAKLEAKRGKRSPARLHASDVASRGHGLDIEDEANELIESLRKKR